MGEFIIPRLSKEILERYKFKNWYEIFTNSETNRQVDYDLPDLKKIPDRDKDFYLALVYNKRNIGWNPSTVIAFTVCNQLPYKKDIRFHKCKDQEAWFTKNNGNKYIVMKEIK